MFHLAGCSAQQPVAQGNGRPAGDSARPNFPQESSEPVCRNTPDLEIGSAPGIELFICKHNYMPLVAEVWCMYSFYQSERFFYLEFFWCIASIAIYYRKKPLVCCGIWFSLEFLIGVFLALAGLKLLRGPGWISGYPYFWRHQNSKHLPLPLS